MEKQDVDEAPLPAVTLAMQDGQRFRNFSPAVGVESVKDAVRLILFAHMTPQAHDQLHVFADGVFFVALAAGEIAADFNNAVFVEKAESAGNDQQGVDLRPAETAGHEGPQVFDGLEARQVAGRKSDMSQLAAINLAAINRKDIAAHGDWLFRRIQDCGG